jgi:predicted transcriptional regulator
LIKHKVKVPADPSVRKSPIRIASLDRNDVIGVSDHIKILRELVSVNDDMYPGIDRWLATKVMPGIRSGERKAYIAFEEDKPIAAAILKLGKSAKFCHLRISESYQNADLGQILFIQMTLDIRGISEEIHFTLPESLWYRKGGFFRSFGFARATKTARHYRKNDTELSCSAPVSRVYSAVLSKIPRLFSRFSLGKYSDDANVLMSVKPAFAEKLVGGSKTIEIRKRFSGKWVGHDAIFYASRPLACLVGRAKISSVTKDQPSSIWSQFGSRIGCSRAEFDAYVGTADEVVAVEMKDAVPYKRSVPVSELSEILRQPLTPPQSYLELAFKKTCTWLNAVYLADSFQRGWPMLPDGNGGDVEDCSLTHPRRQSSTK